MPKMPLGTLTQTPPPRGSDKWNPLQGFIGVFLGVYRVKGPKNGPPPQYEPITTLGKQGDYKGFHFLDPLTGPGIGSQRVSSRLEIS